MVENINKNKTNKTRILFRMISNDILLGKRISAGNSTVFIFVIILAFLFGLFFNNNPQIINIADITPILYLSTIVIASAMRLSSTFVYERENGILDLFVVSPLPKDILFVTKIISNFIFLFIVNFVSFISLALFLNLQVGYLMLNSFLVISFVLIPFSIIGTFVSSLMIQSQRNDVLFSSILIPLEMPVLLGTIYILSNLVSNQLFPIASLWYLALYTIFIFFISAYIFERVIDSYS